MSGAARSEPPRLATRALLAIVPSGDRGRSIVGDLIEEWHGRPAGLARDLWYIAACARVGARYALARGRGPHALGRGRPHRPRDGLGGARRRPGFRSLAPLADLRLALRSAARTPGTSALTVLALAAGIAAPTIMFSLLVGATRDLPVPEPNELVHVGWRYSPTNVRGAGFGVLRPFLEDGVGSELEAIGLFNTGQRDISGEAGFPDRRRTASLSAGVFEVLGVAPALGRAFGPADVAAARSRPTVIVSDALWRERFGGDPAALGRTIRVDGVPHALVGVMGPGFAFPDDTDVWLPLDPTDPSRYTWSEIIGRLAPGGSLAALRERADRATQSLREQGFLGHDVRSGLDAAAWSDRALHSGRRGMLLTMAVVVSFVLVIACADVAHLFLARAIARQRATAVRIALGAGRWRVVRQHLAESGVLAALGGLLGLGIAWIGIRVIEGAMAARLAWWMEIRLDPVVLLFATGLVAFAALFTAILPALHATRVDAAGPLRAGDRGQSPGRAVSRLTGGLVVTEVALTCTLLVVAGLLVRGALRNLEVEAGYETASVLAGTYTLGEDRYADEQALGTFHRELVERLAARPEVAAVSLTSHLPGVYTAIESVELESATYERPEDRPRTHVARIAPGYLDVLGVRPVRGRGLRWSDDRETPLVALVNEPFVRRYLQDVDPIGARVRLAPEEGDAGASSPLGADAAGEAGGSRPAVDEGWATVVGVVPSLGMNGGWDPDDTGIYLPMAAAPPHGAHLLVRTRSGTETGALVPLARAVLADLDSDVALAQPRSLQDAIRANRDMESLFAALFTFFGVSGLVLAGVGLYGLTAFTLGRRLRELGIRSALGARPGSLVWTAVRGGTLQIAIGLAAGLAVALLVSPLPGTLFMGYDARDPVAYLAVALTLLATGAAATLGPAWRGSSTDPATVLRAD